MPTLPVQWNQYRGANRERWAELLQALLAEARSAIDAKNDPMRQAVYDELSRYIKDSPNHFSNRLDQLANATLQDLFNSATDDLLRDISSRTAEISGYISDVRAIAEEANAAASLLNLSFARDAIDSTTASIASLKQLAESVRAEGATTEEAKKAAAQLKKDIESAIKAIQKARNSIENAPGGAG